MRERTQFVARNLSRKTPQVESGKAKLVETRNMVRSAWWTISDILIRDKQPDLAAEVTRFAEQMPPAVTEREWLSARVPNGIRPAHVREGRSP